MAQKKIENIQKHINTHKNLVISKTALKKRRVSEITPPEKNLRFVDLDINDLESHPVGTPVTNRTSSKTPRTRSSRQASGTGDKYAFLFSKARFIGSGYGGDDDDDDPKRNRKASYKKNSDQSGK